MPWKKGDPNHPRRGRGAGKGDGWGGPARGKGAAPFKPGMEGGPGRLAELVQSREERNRMLKDHLFMLGLSAERQETQVSAAVAWLDRDEGKPIQRSDVTSGGEKVFTIVTGVPRAGD